MPPPGANLRCNQRVTWAWCNWSRSEDTVLGTGPKIWHVIFWTLPLLQHPGRPHLEDGSAVRWKEPSFSTTTQSRTTSSHTNLIAQRPEYVWKLWERPRVILSRIPNPSLFQPCYRVTVEVHFLLWFSKAQRTAHRLAAPLLPILLTAAQNATCVLLGSSASQHMSGPDLGPPWERISKSPQRRRWKIRQQHNYNKSNQN